LAIETENCALPILAKLNTREALTYTVVAPTGIVAVVLACLCATVISRVFSTADALQILITLSVAIATIWALGDRTVSTSAIWHTEARAIRIAASEARAVVRAQDDGTIVSGEALSALARAGNALSVLVAVVQACALGAINSRKSGSARTKAIITQAIA